VGLFTHPASRGAQWILLCATILHHRLSEYKRAGTPAMNPIKPSGKLRKGWTGGRWARHQFRISGKSR